MADPVGTVPLSDGGHLQYSEAGDGAPVVLLHGFGLDGAMWEPQWLPFASRYRTIRYDFRGYGASSVPTGPYSHVDDFRALLRSLGAAPAHLVGLSMGGRYALRIASQAPELVRSLTLIDPALDGHAWSEAWMARWRAIAAAAKTDVRQAKRLWLEHELFAPARARAALAAALSDMVSRYSGWHFKHKDPDAGPFPPTAEFLAKIAVPTQVIVGERDIEDFQIIARRVAEEIPNASRQALPGIGHMANLEDARACNEIVLRHLARC